MILRVNIYITCKIGLKTQKPSNLVNSVNSDQVDKFDKSKEINRLPSLSITHSLVPVSLFPFAWFHNFHSLSQNTIFFSLLHLPLFFLKSLLTSHHLLSDLLEWKRTKIWCTFFFFISQSWHIKFPKSFKSRPFSSLNRLFEILQSFDEPP
jgi:hypothetical protein